MIAEDASRPWARSILLRGQFAHATNNVVICQYWLGFDFPFDLGIPHATVNELIAIGEEPESVQFSENSVTFHYTGGRWIRTQTVATEWPDIGRVLDKADINPMDLPEEFAANLETLRPFVDDLSRCFFVDGSMATHKEEGEGARVEHDELAAGVFPTDACFNINQLRLIAKVATSADFNRQQVLFFGENLRGAISQMRF